MPRLILYRASNLLLLLALLLPLPAVGADDALQRYAVLVGANDGGPDRAKLRYAVTDAQAMAKVFEELGGVAPENRILLLQPKRGVLEESLRQLSRRIKDRPEKKSRTEVILYYSGHSDEEGILLGTERVGYLDLRQALENVPADVRIAILDSCASGAMLREKGGVQRPPFLIDVSSEIKGHAFLTSAAQDEAAQESDRLQGSFFTHSLVTGLRGAADVTNDGRITLNEAYHFAFNETLTRTEKTAGGPQHPNYDIRLVGTGDLVLTDLRGTSGGLLLSDELEGQVYVRDPSGRLVAELHKIPGQFMALGFEPGTYNLTLKQKSATKEAQVVLVSGKKTPVGSSLFSASVVEKTAKRGDADPEDSTKLALATREGTTDVTSGDAAPADEEPEVFLSVAMLPGVNTHGVGINQGVTHFSLGLIATTDRKIQGAAVAPAVTVVRQDMAGLQISGASNVTGRDISGVQVTGGVNVAGGQASGGQIAGAINVVGLELNGFQVGGGVNAVGQDLDGFQIAGGLNVVGGSVDGFQASGGLNVAANVRGGQVTGGVNVASGHTDGFQISGGVNYAHQGIDGTQIATINVARGASGVQIGTVNVATGSVRGLQLGVINIAEDSVAPIGLLSFIRHGYHAVDAFVDENAVVHLGFKTGGSLIYNHWSIGVKQNDDRVYFQPAIALGAHVNRSRIFTDLELIATSPLEYGDWDSDDILGSLRLTVGIPIVSRLTVLAGGSVNVLTSFDGSGMIVPPWHKVLYQGEDTAVRLWPGFQVGLQF